jgi:hypothetical protein
LGEPGFGQLDGEVAATVEAAVEALKELGHTVKSVRIPVLERDFALDVFSLHVLEMKPKFVKTMGLFDDFSESDVKTLDCSAAISLPCLVKGAGGFVEQLEIADGDIIGKVVP